MSETNGTDEHPGGRRCDSAETNRLEPVASAACPACGSQSFARLEIINIAEQHAFYAKDEATRRELTALAEVPEGEVRMLRCTCCGLEYASPLHMPSSLWYGLVYRLHALYPAKRWEFEFVLKSISPADTLGELGCGSGEFLELCRKTGIQASGIDFSSDAIEACLASGLDATLMDAGSGRVNDDLRGDCDLVVAFQVLEHVRDPRSLFRNAHEWTRPKAKLWIAVPSNRRPSRCFGERDYLDQPPHHLTRWTEPALEAIAAGTGWKFCRVVHEPIDLRTALWWICTRMIIYQKIAATGAFANRELEKLVRFALAAPGWLALRLGRREISGHAMLAEYCKTES